MKNIIGEVKELSISAIDFVEIGSDAKPTIITGRAGSGKTTFLKMIADKFIERENKRVHVITLYPDEWLNDPVYQNLDSSKIKISHPAILSDPEYYGTMLENLETEAYLIDGIEVFSEEIEDNILIDVFRSILFGISNPKLFITAHSWNVMFDEAKAFLAQANHFVFGPSEIASSIIQSKGPVNFETQIDPSSAFCYEDEILMNLYNGNGTKKLKWSKD